jgi:hypothetical protein
LNFTGYGVTTPLPVSNQFSQRGGEALHYPHDEETECRIFIGHRCSRGGGLWYVLRTGRHFDPSLWDNPATSASVRLRMADDLVDNKKLIGLTRQEVVACLGEPPKTEYFKKFDLVYYLGPERGFISIDSEWLVLKLGPDCRVERAAIARD